MSAGLLCSASAILRGTEPVSALTQELFILLCSLIFFSSRISSVVISRWHCLTELELGPALAHMWGPGTWEAIIAFAEHWSWLSRWLTARSVASFFHDFLNTTIWLALFDRTWTRASTSPHVRAWHMGSNYSVCRALELTDSDSQVSGFFFHDFLKIQKKRRPHKRLF